MKYIVLLACLFSVTVSAGVFDSKLYKYAERNDVMEIIFHDNIAHCAVYALSAPKEYQGKFDGQDQVGTVKTLIKILNSATMDQLPFYQNIVNSYDRVKGTEDEDVYEKLRLFLMLPHDKIKFSTVQGTLEDVSTEIRDYIMGRTVDDEHAQYTDAAYSLYKSQTCQFVMGQYYQDKGFIRDGVRSTLKGADLSEKEVKNMLEETIEGSKRG